MTGFIPPRKPPSPAELARAKAEADALYGRVTKAMQQQDERRREEWRALLRADLATLSVLDREKRRVLEKYMAERPEVGSWLGISNVAGSDTRQ